METVHVALELRIGERSTILHKSCAYIAHWRNKYTLAQILRIGERKYNLAHILHIGRESCAYIAHWERILRIYCALTHPMHNLCEIQ